MVSWFHEQLKDEIIVQLYHYIQIVLKLSILSILSNTLLSKVEVMGVGGTGNSLLRTYLVDRQ